MIDLFIEGYRADVREDLSSLLTFAIDDIKDFSSRNTTFSKTIIMSGSARNNALFGNIFDVSSANFYDETLPNINYNFNAAKSAAAIIFQDNIQIFKGVIRILAITIDKGSIEYEVAVFGDLGGLVFAMGNKKLEDLDFSSYDLTYSVANIISSWDNAGGSGVYFPLMDYGNYSVNKHDWDYRTFRPALYAKEYIDKMFAAAGYVYDSALFNTTRFKKMVVPHNAKVLSKKTGTQLSIGYDDATGQVFQTGATGLNLEMPNLTALGSFTTADNKTFTYGGTNLTGLTVTVRIEGNYYNDDNTNMFLALDAPHVVGTSYYFIPQRLSASPTPMFQDFTFTLDLNNGDAVRLFLGVNDDTFHYYIKLIRINFAINSAAVTNVQVNLSETIVVNDTIPNNILQKDFLASIVKLFNLYITEDKFDKKKLHIEPYVDFFDLSTANANDWTYKIDRGQPITIKPMSELTSRYYKFNYKDDSDYYNDLYKKRYNIPYGSYLFDSNFEFVNESTDIEIIFAGTPLVGYVGEDKVYSTVFKRTGTATIVEENIDFVIRLLQTKKVTGVTSWAIKDGSTTLSSYTYYGYAGHYDDPDSPNNDLNFGVPNELFFIVGGGGLNVTQFNVYWSPYMAEITDKDSRLLTATIRLSTKDIQALDFSKLVYVDGSVFRINKIEDYNATIEDTCKIELLKLINLTY